VDADAQKMLRKAQRRRGKTTKRIKGKESTWRKGKATTRRKGKTTTRRKRKAATRRKKRYTFFDNVFCKEKIGLTFQDNGNQQSSFNTFGHFLILPF
jgi:hypothetical protein